MRSPKQVESLRHLPSVDQVLRKLQHLSQFPSQLLIEEARSVIAERRQALLGGGSDYDMSVEESVEERLRNLFGRSLRPVINATGVILHTNLGRAPLSDFKPVRRYSNLEYDLATGKRGKRDSHTQDLLQRLLNRPAIVVNNNAAAVFLVLHELAAGHQVIVSRGELIEIGDGFRIPEIMARSGAELREVGTTNRTHLDDYRRAINEKTRLILRVHRSNFQISGFTAKPELKQLCELGREHGVPVYEDLGSGCLVDLSAHGVNEPLVSDSIAARVGVVSFSCDKLLGGPQSGLIAGDEELVTRIRLNPMYRALRVDKLVIESLETTLRHLLLQDWNAIPTLAMIRQPLSETQARAESLLSQLQSMEAEVEESESPIGGGSTPDQTLPTWVLKLAVAKPTAVERLLRAAAIPVIARIERDKIIFDLRTVTDDEVQSLVTAIKYAVSNVAAPDNLA